MFLPRHPLAHDIDRFLDTSSGLPLSYAPAGIVVADRATGFRFDEQAIVVGHGRDDYDRACAALMTWTQFDIGWVKVFPRSQGIEVGTVVAPETTSDLVSRTER